MKTCRFIITHRKGVCPLLRRRPGSQGTFKTCEYVPLCLIQCVSSKAKACNPCRQREKHERELRRLWANRKQARRGNGGRRFSGLKWRSPPPLFVAIAEVEVENLLIDDRDKNCVDGCEDSKSQVPCADGRHDCSLESCHRPSTWGANIRTKHTDVRPPTS